MSLPSSKLKPVQVFLTCVLSLQLAFPTVAGSAGESKETLLSCLAPVSGLNRLPPVEGRRAVSTPAQGLDIHPEFKYSEKQAEEILRWAYELAVAMNQAYQTPGQVSDSGRDMKRHLYSTMGNMLKKLSMGVLQKFEGFSQEEQNKLFINLNGKSLPLDYITEAFKLFFLERSPDEQFLAQLKRPSLPPSPLFWEDFTLPSGKTIKLIRPEVRSSFMGMNAAFQFSGLNELYGHSAADIFLYKLRNELGHLVGDLGLFALHRTNTVIPGVEPGLVLAPDDFYADDDELKRQINDCMTAEDLTTWVQSRKNRARIALAEDRTLYEYFNYSWTQELEFLDGKSLWSFLFENGWQGKPSNELGWKTLRERLQEQQEKGNIRSWPDLMLELFARMEVHVHQKPYQKDEKGRVLPNPYRTMSFEQFKQSRVKDSVKMEMLDHFFKSSMNGFLGERMVIELRRQEQESLERGISLKLKSACKNLSPRELHRQRQILEITRYVECAYTRMYEAVEAYHQSTDEKDRESLREIFEKTLRAEIQRIDVEAAISQKMYDLNEEEEEEGKRQIFLTTYVLGPLNKMLETHCGEGSGGTPNSFPTVEQMEDYLLTKNREVVFRFVTHFGLVTQEKKEDVPFYLSAAPGNNQGGYESAIKDSTNVYQRVGSKTPGDGRTLIPTPQLDLQQFIELVGKAGFKDFDEFSNGVKQFLQDAEGFFETNPEHISAVQQFARLFTLKLKAPLDDAFTEPQFMSARAVTRLKILDNLQQNKPETDGIPWYLLLGAYDMLERGMSLEKPSSCIEVSKAGDEFRAVVRRPNGKILFENIDLKNFQDLDNFTIKRGIKKPDDELYHVIQNTLSDILTEIWLDEQSGTVMSDLDWSREIAVRYKIKRDKIQVNLNPDNSGNLRFLEGLRDYWQDIHDKLYSDVLTLEGLIERHAENHEEPFVNLHCFENIDEVRKLKMGLETDDSDSLLTKPTAHALLKKLRLSLDRAKEKKEGMETLHKRVMLEQRSLQSIPPGFKKDATRQKLKTIEELVSQATASGLFTVFLGDIRVPSTAKADGSTKRIDNREHLKKSDVLVVSKDITEDMRAALSHDLHDAEKLQSVMGVVVEAKGATDAMVDLNKGRGSFVNYYVEGNGFQKAPSSRCVLSMDFILGIGYASEKEDSPYAEVLKPSSADLYESRAFLGHLRDEISEIRSGPAKQKNWTPEITDVFLMASEFLMLNESFEFSVEPNGGMIFFSPQKGRCLSREAIVREWRRAFGDSVILPRRSDVAFENILTFMQRAAAKTLQEAKRALEEAA